MPRGRKRRLKNFEEKAKAFRKSAGIGREGVRKAIRDGRSIKIGTGKHKRLVSKRSAEHVKAGSEVQAELKNFLDSNKINPNYYKLVQAKASPKNRVQEYFNKPSVMSLLDFFWNRDHKNYTGKETWFLCKSFANQHKEINQQKLLQATEELTGHLCKTSLGPLGKAFSSSNIIVLGQTKEGKIRLAIIDV